MTSSPNCSLIVQNTRPLLPHKLIHLFHLVMGEGFIFKWLSKESCCLQAKLCSSIQCETAAKTNATDNSADLLTVYCIGLLDLEDGKLKNPFNFLILKDLVLQRLQGQSWSQHGSSACKLWLYSLVIL